MHLWGLFLPRSSEAHRLSDVQGSTREVLLAQVSNGPFTDTQNTAHRQKTTLAWLSSVRSEGEEIRYHPKREHTALLILLHLPWISWIGR